MTIKTSVAEGDFFPDNGIEGAVVENEAGELFLLMEEVVGLLGKSGDAGWIWRGRDIRGSRR